MFSQKIGSSRFIHAYSTLQKELAACPGKHFIILLRRDRSLIFKSLYHVNLDTKQVPFFFFRIEKVVLSESLFVGIRNNSEHQ